MLILILFQFVSQYLQEHFSDAIRRRLLRGGSERKASLTGHPDDCVIEVHFLTKLIN
ncbi:unnamed protein product [Gongylonema pulchrum]|uniref:Secreted protein n=1 Tax=Gongylonema pulchrum TaxID=637853 RepID=A0A183D675_9BILA|nr:unnamed protein product [Gongylonema pulchrum]